MKRIQAFFSMLGIAIAFLVPGKALAEVREVTVVWQYGINYLPLMVMQNDKLLERRAEKAGLGDLKVNWIRLANAGAVNDALISGQVAFAAVGASSLVTLWAKTRNNVKVRSIGAVCSMPIYLVTRDPAIKTIADFTPKDRIALPGVKVSIQAVLLEMAAAKAFGKANYGKLDPLTVGMSQPEGMIAVLSGHHEVASQFGGPPYQYELLQNPGMHKVLSSYDVLGGSHTYTQVFATTKFYEENPEVSKAFFEALQDADAVIKNDKTRAGEIYRKLSGDKKTSDAVIMAILNDPEVRYTVVPEKTMEFARFMHGIHTIKVLPKSWKDLFFPIVHALPGS